MSYPYAIIERLYESASMTLYRGIRQQDNVPVVIKALYAETPTPRKIEYADVHQHSIVHRHLKSANILFDLQTGRMNRGIDHRSDLYSLGVIFYQTLTGELPFRAAEQKIGAGGIMIKQLINIQHIDDDELDHE